MQIFGVRQATVVHPELLVEALQIHYERVALPFSDGAAVKERIVGITVDLPDLFAAVRPDDAPIAITGAHEDEDSVEVGILDELKARAFLILSRASRGFAVEENRIVLQVIALPV